ncbi:MAG: slipin family protein [Myxococcota bacterium]
MNDIKHIQAIRGTRIHHVPAGYVGLHYRDGAFVRELGPGRHELGARFFEKHVHTVDCVDVRQRSLVIKNQEILTKDKVAIRVSLLVYFRVTDARAASEQVADYVTRIYEDVQLAARRFLATKDLEAILALRNEISDAVRETVEEDAKGYGVEILRADVKDLIFPGNLREIMNRVLETERRAEAQLIQARKDIEAKRLQAQAELDAETHRRAAELERLHLDLEAKAQAAKAAHEREAEALKVALDAHRERLAAAIAEAEALEAHPALVKLKELEALQAMAKAGARFVLAGGAGLPKLLEGDVEA